ncbi:DUF4360 domain-containing protein [Actinomadura syzygii]|uniref:DUF4360 domain-containing protein n=1 Tax=Actinomadura syzygii TaxID=1427538 RepID=UPI0016529588|nr:DUF4360 domain-containing protein [Actinomadura syzygii]
MTVEVATYPGQGCGASSAAIPEVLSQIAVEYGNYRARVGGDSTPADRRKKCQLGLRIHARGFSYAISRVTYRGYAELEPGATGTVTGLHQLQGASPRSVTRAFTGPYSGAWTVDDPVPTDQLVYSPCGEERFLGLRSELSADAGTSNPSKTSVMGMDPEAPPTSTTYYFTWKKCGR